MTSYTPFMQAVAETIKGDPRFAVSRHQNTLSLNRWRKEGWTIGARKYSCYAFAAVHPPDMRECMSAIYLLNGINVGLSLPISAQYQEVWDIPTVPGGVKGSWGGHCVYIKAYDGNGLTCVTWGGLKKMTWAFFTVYCDEAYAIIDNRNLWLGDASPVDLEKLSKYLQAVS